MKTFPPRAVPARKSPPAVEISSFGLRDKDEHSQTMLYGNRAFGKIWVARNPQTKNQNKEKRRKYSDRFPEELLGVHALLLLSGRNSF